MSVTAWLQQISARGLEMIKNDLAIYEQVIFYLEPVNSDSPVIADISELTSSKIKILEYLTADLSGVVNCWTDWDVKVLEDLRRDYPEMFERLKPDLYAIVANEKQCADLDFGKAWDWIGYILRDGQSMSQLVDTAEGRLNVNIFFGKSIEPYEMAGSIRFQEVNEVLEVAKILSQLDDTEIQRRFEQAVRIKGDVYRGDWSRDAYPLFMEYVREVKGFYKNAAEKGYGVMFAVG
jgi:Domain of unknown function (DUF1877)